MADFSYPFDVINGGMLGRLFMLLHSGLSDRQVARRLKVKVKDVREVKRIVKFEIRDPVSPKPIQFIGII